MRIGGCGFSFVYYGYLCVLFSTANNLSPKRVKMPKRYNYLQISFKQ